jgi:hypothetical protein
MTLIHAVCKTIKEFELIEDKDLLIIFHDGTAVLVNDSKDFYEKLAETNGNGSIGTI